VSGFKIASSQLITLSVLTSTVSFLESTHIPAIVTSLLFLLLVAHISYRVLTVSKDEYLRIVSFNCHLELHRISVYFKIGLYLHKGFFESAFRFYIHILPDSEEEEAPEERPVNTDQRIGHHQTSELERIGNQ
jgi:hypothetical protein